MNIDVIYELIKVALQEAALLTAPILIVVLVIGVSVSLLQTVTSIQEQTLTFVPKLLGAGAVIYIFGPWMLGKLTGLASEFIQRAGEIVR